MNKTVYKLVVCALAAATVASPAAAQAAPEEPTDIESVQAVAADTQQAIAPAAGEAAEDALSAESTEGPTQVEVLADDEEDLPVAGDDEPTGPGDDSDEDVAGPDYTGWVDEDGVPCTVADAAGWVDEGVAARSKFFYDSATNAWYWTEADGSVSRNHDAFVPLDNSVAGTAWETATDEWRSANGKWVRLGADGAMVKGVSTIGDDQWYFDEVTGAMQYGFRLVTDGGCST